MMCPTCIAVKDKPLTYIKCEKCEGYRLPTPKEKLQLDKRKPA